MELGIYYRVEREGKWDNVDILDMSPEEIAEYIATPDTPRASLCRLIVTLVRAINAHLS